MVIEPLTKKINYIIKNNKHQEYADCTHRKYYTRINPNVQRPPNDLEIEKDLFRFLDWMKFHETYYRSNLYEAFFERLAKPLYDKWKAQELAWPEFPIDVPGRVKRLSGYYTGKYTTVTFSTNDLNDVRGFITAGHILYAGLKGNLGDYDMKCKTYVESNIDHYICCWQNMISKETGVDWWDL